jgi:hypothetical protein
LMTIAGEVYASRSGSVTWSQVNCSNRTRIIDEETTLQFAPTASDGINRTFNNTVHRQFYVGANRIANSNCPAISTYVNNTRQATSETALFQEVLLSDGPNLVLGTIIEPGMWGFDGGRYNFQLIVPENEYAGTPTPYFFYLELS